MCLSHSYLLLRLHQDPWSAGGLGTVAVLPRFESCVRYCLSLDDDRGWRSNSAWGKGQSIKEAFPEEVTSKEVEYELTRPVNKSNTEAEGTLEPRERSFGSFRYFSMTAP